jgi:NAD(P)-dependent dehydrogenase (short-subunit alcohol dehydrogenase family)
MQPFPVRELHPGRLPRPDPDPSQEETHGPLAGEVAVVTGAGKGIGLAVTRTLAEEGAHVVAGSRTTENLDGLKGVNPVAIDLAAPDGPAEPIRRATEEHGRIDVLVNNVGAVRMRTEGFLGTSDDDFAWTMEMNFFIALRASRAAITEMVSQGSGAIIAGLGGFATGRFTTPEEVAALIAFLASDRAGNITGVDYLIDGGLIKTT